MMNRADLPTASIYSAQAILKDRWGVEIKYSLFLDWAYDAIRRIGFNTDIVKTAVQVSAEGIINLPFDATNIKRVTTASQQYYNWGAVSIGDDLEDIAPIDTTTMDYNQADMYYMRADDVDFEILSPNVLSTTVFLADRIVFVLAEAKVLDSEGLPMITEKQASAIADWCAYIYTQRNAFAGIKGIDLMYMKKNADMAIASARVPENVSENEWDMVLDAKTSFGRKGFNVAHQWR